MKRSTNIIRQETDADRTGIALGWCASIGRHRLGEGLLAFAARHPEIDIGVHDLSPTALVAALRRGKLDLIILPGASRPEFTTRPLWCEPIRIAIGPDHPLAARQEVTEEDLVDIHFLVQQDDQHRAVHRLLLDHLGRNTLPTSSMRAASLERIEAEIAMGSGAALFCGDWPGDRTDLSIKPLAPPRDRIGFHAYWHGRSGRSGVDDLVELLASSTDRWG